MQFYNVINHRQVFWLKAKQCGSTATLTQILPPRHLPGESNLKYINIYLIMKCYNDAKKWYLNSIIMQVCGRSTRQWLRRRLFRHRQHLTELPHGHCQVWGISWILLNFYSFGHFSLSFEHFTMSGWRWRTRLENQKRQKLFKSDVSKILILKLRNITHIWLEEFQVRCE